MASRYLITTANERTWEMNQPVLFLGEWCRLYSRKHIWEGMDAVVAEPYGLKEAQKERDLDYVYSLYGQLLKELAGALNEYHKVDHSLRYWHILLGPWLQRYLRLTYNRFFTLEQALGKYDVSGTTVFESKTYSLATIDSLSFEAACEDDTWNHIFFSRILNFIGHGKIELNFEPFLDSGRFDLKLKRPAPHPILNVASKILPKFSRKNDAFIISSYLRIKDEALLQLCLGQCPQYWRSPELNTVEPEKNQRQCFNIDPGDHKGFERFVRLQLSEVIPSCFLEGYGQLILQVESLPWPEKPKFIFTSVHFDTFEVFKAWAGSKVEQGTPYYTGQHGNHYGTSRFYQKDRSPECLTSDRFITWGWTNGESKNIPAFAFITANRKPRRQYSEGRLLLVELPLLPRSDVWDKHFEHSFYQEEQFRFVEALPQAIQQKLLVRLHPCYRIRKWFESQRWKDRSPHTKLETGVKPLHELISQSRLVVNSYDSTTILECMALNIPIICFWRGGLSHLMPEAKPYYELLRNVGILADTPEQAAELVALHWDNLEGWWESKKVQDVRREFCQQYARTEKNPIRKLKQLLTSL